MSEVPRDRRVIHSKWVLRNKLFANGQIARRKARVVAKGFQQQYRVDYNETFASVVRHSTIRWLIAKVATENLAFDNIDVDTAFLNPKLEEEIYIHPPQYFSEVHPEYTGKTIFLKLLKSLYGLKQAPRAWMLEVQAFFNSIGFEAALADPNLFIRDRTYILLFVDDMAIAGPREAIDAVKREISSRWDCKDLGPYTLFVGIQLERTAESIKIYQTLYTTKLLERLKISTANPYTLPILVGKVLRATDSPLLDDEEAALYRYIIGSLIYLSNVTRPDIAYATGQLARFISNP